MTKIVYRDKTSEQTYQHHSVGLLKQHPGANKKAPQDRSIKITPRSKQISCTTGPVYQNKPTGANKSAPQGQSIEITTQSQ